MASSKSGKGSVKQDKMLKVETPKGSRTSLLIVIAIAAALLGVAIQALPGPFGSTSLSQQEGSTTASSTPQATEREDQACVSLTHWLPDIVYLPGTVGFANQWRAHWSEEAQKAVPSCVVKPRNTTEVSNVVQVLKNLYDLPYLARARGTGGSVDTKVRFAIRSGGHSVELGQSSIQGGVLIDLAILNTVTIAEDKESVLMGPGARWGAVYAKLDEVGLATAGGRNGHVGVGGLSLGGGLSWLSPQVGMVQDNILEYEIVLANGSVIYPTEERHPDLWRALKGGSGSFGIVTSIKARTFPATKVWGGYVYYLNTKSIVDKLLNAFYDFGRAATFDEKAAGPILSFGTFNVLGFRVSASANHILYTKPKAWPAAWNAFEQISRVWSAAKVRSFTSAAQELVDIAPYGKEQHQATLTIKNDLETIRAFHKLYARSWEKVKHVKGVTWALVLQPLTPAIIHRGSTNALGLESRNASEPLIIVLLSNSWTDGSQNALMYQATRDLIAFMEIEAMRRNTLDRYLYLNYAATWQNVFASYGEDSHGFLREVSKKYDEHAFWQHARPGGFKLGLDRPGVEAYPQHAATKTWVQPVYTPPPHVHESGSGHQHHHHHRH